MDGKDILFTDESEYNRVFEGGNAGERLIVLDNNNISNGGLTGSLFSSIFEGNTNDVVVDNIYSNVRLVSINGGLNATVNITVSGNIITEILVNNPGQGYTSGDILIIPANFDEGRYIINRSRTTDVDSFNEQDTDILYINNINWSHPPENTRSYLLYDGTLLKHGTVEELSNDEEVRRLYLGSNFSM